MEVTVTSSVKKNFAYQITYRILTIITPLITSPILARALGAEKIGIYSATLAFVNYFTLFAMLGVENYGTRSIAEAQGDQDVIQERFWNIYAVQVFTSGLALIVYGIILGIISSDRFLVMLIQALWIISSLLNVNWFFFGLEQFKVTVTRNIIIKLITVFAVVIFIRTPDDLPLYALIMAGDAALSSIVVWPFLKKQIHFQMPNIVLMKQHIKPIVVLFIPLLGITMFHIMDKTMLDLFSTEAQSGFYYNTDKLINIPYGIINAISVVMLPRISNVYSKNQKDTVKSMLDKSTELSMFLTCAIGIGIAAIAREFVPLFFGNGFEECIRLVYWFFPVLFIKAISVLIRSQYMIPAKKDSQYTIAVMVGVLVNLVANYFLIRSFGALGAVLGTLFAEFALMLVELLYSIKDIPFIKYIISHSAYVLFGVVMFIAVRITADKSNTPILIKLITMVFIGALVYLLMCLVYWKLNKKSIFHTINLQKLLIWKTNK